MRPHIADSHADRGSSGRSWSSTPCPGASWRSGIRGHAEASIAAGHACNRTDRARAGCRPRPSHLRALGDRQVGRQGLSREGPFAHSLQGRAYDKGDRVKFCQGTPSRGTYGWGWRHLQGGERRGRAVGRRLRFRREGPGLRASGRPIGTALVRPHRGRCGRSTSSGRGQQGSDVGATRRWVVANHPRRGRNDGRAH